MNGLYMKRVMKRSEAIQKQDNDANVMPMVMPKAKRKNIVMPIMMPNQKNDAKW